MGYRYILFHKPFNVLSQFSADGSDKRTLKEFIPIADVYPVGRLDYDSEGLMLLTNDGKLQHQLSHPKFAHPRTYWAQVERIPSEDALNALRQGGITIQNYQTRPAKAKLLGEIDIPPRNPPIRFRKSVPTAWLELTLTEGRNRQVRRMTAAIGHPTLRLIRIEIGDLQLADLLPGTWRDLTSKEEGKLLSLGRSPRRGRRRRR